MAWDDLPPDAPAGPSWDSLPPEADAPKRGLVGKTWDALAIPERMSRQGLQSIANVIPQPDPTGNLPMDLLRGTPRIAADTLAETAPQFVSRSAIIGGALGKTAELAADLPAVKSAASVLGDQGATMLEKVSGINRRSIENAFTNPKALFTAPTKDVVRDAYSSSEIASARNAATNTDDVASIVDRATSGVGKAVKRAGQALLDGTDDAETLLKGRQNIDKQIAQLGSQLTTAKDGRSAIQGQIADKLKLRELINSRLDDLAPMHRAADAVASQQLAVDPFRRMFLPGKMHFASPEGWMRAIPGVPLLAGAGLSGAGGIANLLGLGLQNAGPIGYGGGASMGLYKELRDAYGGGG